MQRQEDAKAKLKEKGYKLLLKEGLPLKPSQNRANI